MPTLIQDLQFGLRVLFKHPGFTAVAVLAIALGIGANSTIFSLVNALLLRPLPVENPGQLVSLYTSDHSGTIYGMSAYPDYIDFRERNKVFSGLLRGFVADLWVPTMMSKAVLGSNDLAGRNNRSLLLMGRLKPGITFLQAQADFRLIVEQLLRSYPWAWKNVRNESRIVTLMPESQSRVHPEFREPVLLFTAMLMAVVGLVLLIACANVANLLMVRAATRRREIAIRLSLGAGRGRLIRQLITESLLLSLAGGFVGLLLAAWGTDLLMAFKPPVPVPVEIDLGFDWRVLGFTFGVSLLTGILFGLAPAFTATRIGLVAALKDEAGAVGSSGGRMRLRNAFVVVQVALSLLLLIGSGLFLRSLRNASSIDLGFNPENLMAMSMDLRLQGYDETKGRNFYQQMLDRVRALPGVVSAGLTEELPLSLNGSSYGITIEGYTRQPGESMEVNSAAVTPGFFDAMQIQLLSGRAFNDQDRTNSPGVVMISEAFARRYWPGQKALGKRIQMGVSDNNRSPYLEVVGVVKDAKYVTLGEEVRPFFYRPMAQNYLSSVTLVVRARNNPLDYLAAVRAEVAALDKNLSLFDVKTMRQHLRLALLPARLAGTVLGIFGLIALGLAASGIYGVMAYSVAQRTREIGIHMALGARGVDVLKLIVKQGMKLVVIGLSIGLMAAFAMTRMMNSFLYGVSSTDPFTFIGVALLLAFVALLACYMPARRATTVDPMVALRYE